LYTKSELTRLISNRIQEETYFADLHEYHKDDKVNLLKNISSNVPLHFNTEAFTHNKLGEVKYGESIGWIQSISLMGGNVKYNRYVYGPVVPYQQQVTNEIIPVMISWGDGDVHTIPFNNKTLKKTNV